MLLALAGAGQAAQLTIDGPVGSGEFGRSVTVLPNGNIVVTDPGFDAPGPVADVGAVHVYRPDGTLISTLRGSSANDRVGNGGVRVLATGNFVVSSPLWRNGEAAESGAATFGSGTIGISGLITPSNSLVGSASGDQVGSVVTPLNNGNYLVASSRWDNGPSADAGAVTFGSGTTGISGVVSAANSLVGSASDDKVGSVVTPLSNGNYVVSSGTWDNGPIIDAGAVTFGSGTTGISGVVSAANSLVGSTTSDRVGGDFNYVISLGNGNYVVRSPDWDNGAIVDAGAVTFGSGTTGIAGVVSPTNSLVGSAEEDSVGFLGVTVLANHSYVVNSAFWDNGAISDAGAVTFGSGTNGISGVISPDNSLVGTMEHDLVGSGRVIALRNGVMPLANGSYVVRSPAWDNGTASNAGAATFGSGTTGISGEVSSVNSLVGSTANDEVGGFDVTALANGNYLVGSPRWDNGAIVDAGFVSFGSGTSGISGTVSLTNSLVGSTANDQVGNSGAIALANGNYVVRSARWTNGGVINAGAVTFGSGATGISGVVSPSNSLVGSTANDFVGFATGLSNGNYVVASSGWDNGPIVDAGAATFASGTTGISGVITPSNSLVGGAPGDQVGSIVTPLTNGNYVVTSSRWDNGPSVDAGAVTFGSGISGMSGLISQFNSLVGGTSGDEIGGIGFGIGGVTVLGNGNYVVNSPYWDNGVNVNAGAVTLGSGISGFHGVVSPANSLVGSARDDQVGFNRAIALGNNGYLAVSYGWDNGAIVDAGAITLGLADGSVVGIITDTHSVLGAVANQGLSLRYAYDEFRNQLVVGQPASNLVVLHRTGLATAISIVSAAPDPSIVGQPVNFTATVSAFPNAPTNGQVTFTASSGESCVDTTPTATSATTAAFSCAISFSAEGSSTVIAEYTGSISHAYSGSEPDTHTTVVVVFANGFESP